MMSVSAGLHVGGGAWLAGRDARERDAGREMVESKQTMRRNNAEEEEEEGC